MTAPRRARASRCTSTPSATAPSARRSTRSRPPVRANGPSDLRHHLAHLQVVHPDDIPRFRAARRASRTPSRCGRRTSRRWTSSRSRSSASRGGAGSTRSASLVAAGATARDGQRLVGLQPRPARGDPRRGQPRDARRLRLRGRQRTRSFLPEERLDLADVDRRLHDRLGVREPPRRRDRLDRGGQARRPRGGRPRTSSPTRSDEIADAASAR